MKYSINGFSQEKLLEYDLDILDAAILNWFSDFYSGKMAKIIVEENGIKKIYGWVKASKILEDLPTLPIKTEKGIRRRFETYVENGILDRKVISTKSGKRSFYYRTDIFDSLVNTTATEIIKNKTNNQTNINKENNISQVENPQIVNSKNENQQQLNNNLKQQDYLDSLAKEKNDIQNQQRTKTTFAKNNNTVNHTQDHLDGLAQSHSNSLAQDHLDSLALNDSLVKDSLVKDTAVKLTELTNKHFGKDYFDSEFNFKAAAFFSQNNFIQNNYEGYFMYIKEKVSKKQVENARGLAYTLFFQVDILKEYQEYQEKQELERIQKEKEAAENEKKKIVCPCCSQRFIPSPYQTECGWCDFPIKNFNNETEIFQYKRFLKLPLLTKDKYIEEINSFKSDMDTASRIRFLASEEGKKQRLLYETNIKKRYGIIA